MTSRSWTHNIPQLQDSLHQVADRATDVTPVWRQLVTWYTGTAKEQFSSPRWAKLDKRYARYKAKTHPGKGVMSRTGALYEGLTEPEVHDIGPTEAVVGIRTGVGRSNLFYAQFHQEARGVPRRVVMPRMPRTVVDDLLGDLAAHILGGAR